MDRDTTNQSVAVASRENFEGKLQSLEEFIRASLNILEDSSLERSKLEEMQRATFNIFEDINDEEERLKGIHRATLNILEDFNTEKSMLEKTQRASMNILEDFEAEKEKVEVINQALSAEVAERKQVEEQLVRHTTKLAEVNKELEAFSYSVSHDLRAPLRSIGAFSQTLLEEAAQKLNAEEQEYLRRICAAAQQMGQLIDGLLDLSRLMRSALLIQPLDLSQLAQGIVKELQQAEPQRQVQFQIAPQLVAQGDPRLLLAVLQNLLSNAWKFSNKQPVAHIQFDASDENGKTVFFVRDDGVGFDMAYADKLFGAFQRLHGIKEFPGTGIGLATVQRIIHRHGGRIWAEAAIGKGATFHFTLNPERKS